MGNPLAGVIEAGDVFQVPAVGGLAELGQGIQAVDGLEHGGPFSGGLSVTMADLPDTLEVGDIIGGSLDTQDDTVFVVHLETHCTHLVLDPGALDTGVEGVAHFALVEGREFPSQKGGDVLRFDGVDGGTDQVLIKGCEVFLAVEEDVGGVLGLHDAPVVGTPQALDDRAEHAGVKVEDLVEVFHPQLI